MTTDLQQALDFLRSEREHEEQALVVNIHTGAGLEHVWTLLDRVEALADVAAAARALDGAVHSGKQWAAIEDALATLDALNTGEGRDDVREK